MGLESACTLKLPRGNDAGIAHLDSTELLFRGDSRRTYPLAGAKATAKASSLTISGSHGDLTLTFDDAATATRWAEKINNPRSRMQKLGVKPDSRVLVLDMTDPEVLDELSSSLDTPPSMKLPAGVVSKKPAAQFDVMLIAIRTPTALKSLKPLVKHLAPKGGLWVLWPKGRKDLRHEEVVAAAKLVGLSQTKSAAFNDELTGLRLTHAAKSGSA